METTDTAVLDLRERSVARGQSQSGTGQAPLQIPRAAKHLVLYLPIGSKEGPYDFGLLQKKVMRLCARRESRICMITLLVCGSMLTSVAFGREHILLGFDSLLLNGLNIRSGCFDLLIPIHW